LHATFALSHKTEMPNPQDQDETESLCLQDSNTRVPDESFLRPRHI